jgi:hypothetical protein
MSRISSVESINKNMEDLFTKHIVATVFQSLIIKAVKKVTGLTITKTDLSKKCAEIEIS